MIINKNHELNYELLSNNYFSTDDLLIEPSTGFVKSRSDINLDSETFIYSSPMDTVASESLFYAMLSTNQAPVSCRFSSRDKRLAELDLFLNNPNYWFSVGSNLEDFEMLSEYLKESEFASINIAVDVAHGDTSHMHKIYDSYSSESWCRSLMSGTVATVHSAKNCFDHGCTHIRVGIGPGSACTTRIVTGCGVPNISAVFKIWDHFSTLLTPPKIIADGGIRTTGDIAKYLAAGANGVMVGNLLSKTNESSGWKTDKLKFLLNVLTFGLFCKDYVYKHYRGQASAQFQKEKRGFISGTPEGVQGPRQTPQYTWDCFYENTVSALRSTLSYTGLLNLKSLNPKNVKLIKITENGFKESKPNLLS